MVFQGARVRGTYAILVYVFYIYKNGENIIILYSVKYYNVLYGNSYCDDDLISSIIKCFLI